MVAGTPSLLCFFVLLLLLVVVVKKELEGVVGGKEGLHAPPPPPPPPPPRSPSQAKETPGQLPRALAPLGAKSDVAQPHPDSAFSGSPGKLSFIPLVYGLVIIVGDVVYTDFGLQRGNLSCQHSVGL